MIFARKAARDINDEQDQFAAHHRFPHLGHHLAAQRSVGAMNSRSVDEHNLAAQLTLLPGHVDDSQNAVARGLGLGTDDGQLFADQSIEQGRFAGVRTTQNADESGVKGHKNFVAPASRRLSRRHFASAAGETPAGQPPGRRRYRRPDYISFICVGLATEILTRSTRRSVDSSTSKRRPSSSITSPRWGMRPASSLTSPATVADSLPSGRIPNISTRRSTSILPGTM